MNETFTLTVGALIGNNNATYPFTTLRVNKETLTLDASVVGYLVFEPKDIMSIEPYSLIPAVGKGIKISHRIPHYEPNVIFWTVNEPEPVIQWIRTSDFWTM